MERLVTYDLALLLVDPAKERFIVDSATLDHALAAAALIDAVHAGVVSVDLLAKETSGGWSRRCRRLRRTLSSRSSTAKRTRSSPSGWFSTSAAARACAARNAASATSPCTTSRGSASSRPARPSSSAPAAPWVKVVDKARRESVLSAVRGPRRR